MGEIKLTTLQETILHFLARRKPYDCNPTAMEIGETIFRGNGRADKAAGALRRMAERHLVARTGVSPAGARCWDITPAGRAALSDQGERE